MQIFYGWILVAVCFVLFGLVRGVNSAFSVFYVAFLEEFGWSRAVVAGAYSIGRLVAGISAVGAGWLNDRLSPRMVVPLGAVILSGGLFLGSYIDSLWLLYLSNGVAIALGLSLAGEVPNSALLSRWFIKKRGMAMGIATSGIGMGILVLVPLTQRWITLYGWREAYLLLSVLTLLMIFPLGAIFLRQDPEKMGILPDGLSPMPDTSAGQRTALRRRRGTPSFSRSRNWTTREAMHTLPFWFLFLSRCLSPIGMSAIIPHQVAYIVDTGFSKLVAAVAFGFSGILSSAGRIFFGILSDHIGREKAVTLSFLLSILGIFLLIQIRDPSQRYLLYAHVVVFGVGMGSRMPILSSLTADLFHGTHYGSLLGIMALGQGIGGTLGPWMSGYIFDRTGSYLLSFSIAMGMLLCSCLCVWLARWFHQREKVWP